MLEFIGPALEHLFTLENFLWINLGVFIGSVFAASCEATSATWGPKNRSIKAEKIPPKVEAYKAIFKAAFVRPFWDRGCPSIIVVAAWGVPGVLIKIADTLPPYPPAQYMPRRNIMPGIAVIL